MSLNGSVRQVLKEWHDTISKTNKQQFQPFWQSQLEKLRRLKPNESNASVSEEESTTWYTGENTDSQRYISPVVGDGVTPSLQNCLYALPTLILKSQT